jgi:NAD(P)-dependent dehydrogenase (short-subunit alcohol dehydrogenase family)
MSAINSSAPTFLDRAALVTGAASGLGRATAEGLAQGGARLVLFDRDAEGLRQTAAACPGAICIIGDVTRAADIERAVAAAAPLGPISLLATAAGMVGPTVPLTEMTEPDWDMLFAVNVKGTWLTLRAVLPIMQQAGQGAIVTFASGAGLTGSPVMPAYSATKAAVVMMSRSLARAHAAEGIRINCVCPGSIETPMLEATFAGAPSPEARAQREAEFRARHPMLRFGQAGEVSAAVLFLLSDAASFMTGVSLPIDGGRLA